MNIAVLLPSLKDSSPIQVAKDIVEKLIIEGCRVEVFYLKDIVELSFDCPINKISLFEKFDFENYDIIHSHMIRPNFYIWYYKKNIKNLCVSTLHNEIDKVLKDHYGILISKIFTPLWVIFLKAQDQVICLSKVAKKQLEKKYNITKSTYIYNGRTVSDGYISSDDIDILELKKDKYVILGIIANISKIKGIDQIINSLDKLDDFCLVIIGDGPDLERLKNLVRGKGLDERCVFFGYKKNAYLFLEYIDIYMMTSYSEGFPLVMIEAAQYKKPIVCSNLPIFNEFFNENQVSFFELDNKHSLINAVKIAVNKKNILSKNIYDVYLEKYTKNIMGFNYYTEFKNLSKRKEN